MKIRRSLFLLLVVLFSATLVACSFGSDNGNDDNVPTGTLQICVGSESVWLYQEVLNAYNSEIKKMSEELDGRLSK